METAQEAVKTSVGPVPPEAVLRQYREQHGLKLAFRPGEMFPWKGINFRVSKVEVDSLTLIPVSMTSRRAKEKHHAR